MQMCYKSAMASETEQCVKVIELMKTCLHIVDHVFSCRDKMYNFGIEADLKLQLLAK